MDFLVACCFSKNLSYKVKPGTKLHIHRYLVRHKVSNTYWVKELKVNQANSITNRNTEILALMQSDSLIFVKAY